MRTIQAVRQVIYAALTSPQISYMVNDDGPFTLPVANVSARPTWAPAVGGQPDPPTPYVAFAVGGSGHDVMLAERAMRMQIWISSCSSNVAPDDEVTELYEAIREILHGADDDDDPGSWLQFRPPSLSRSDTAQTLGLAIRRCREMNPGALPADFEPSTARWYVSARYEIVAV